MRGTILSLLSLGAAIVAPAQFYPESNATWCLGRGNSEFVTYVTMQMSNNPDTLIMGRTYQRIDEFRSPSIWQPEWQYWESHYVRSSADGKGYYFLVDSMAEYLTGDLNTQAGDTVHNVLVRSFSPTGQLLKVIVDSVAIISNAGVVVSRHYLHTIGYDNPGVGFIPYRFFWQAGMGTSQGPVLEMASGLSPTEMMCAVVNDIPQVGADFNNAHLGLPGGSVCCWSVTVGMEESLSPKRLIASPNPSTALFQLNGNPSGKVRVCDACGREVLVTRDRAIDLTAHPPGVYTAVVSTAMGWQTLRLVVVR